MKSIRIAGLCLVAMFMMSMAITATASAANWEQCATEKAATAATKYETNQCGTVIANGKWAWQEVTNTEDVRIRGSLRLTDTKIPIVGKVSIECSGEGQIFVGPKDFGVVTRALTTNATQCRNIENCEKIEQVEMRNTPWQLETHTESGKVTGTLTGILPGGEPGWKVTCRVLGVTETDECTTVNAEKPESVELRNHISSKGTELELLVLMTFQKLRKAKCTIGGGESGEISGSLSLLKENGWGLRVS